MLRSHCMNSIAYLSSSVDDALGRSIGSDLNITGALKLTWNNMEERLNSDRIVINWHAIILLLLLLLLLLPALLLLLASCGGDD